MCLCLSVCPSVTSWHRMETDEWIKLVFCRETTLSLLVPHCIGREFGCLHNKGTYLCNILPETLDLEKFQQSTSTVASVVNFVRLAAVASLSQ